MDAPFRLAPLATHPLSGGGQEKDGFPLPSRSARHPSPKWGWARKTWMPPFRLAPLATHPPKWGWARKTWMPPSVSLRSPPTPLSGGGQEKYGGEGRLTQNLASPRSRGEGDHEVVEGGCLKAVDACEAGIRTLSKERVSSNIKGQVNQITHLAGRQPAASCPIQLFQHIKHPLTGRAFHVFIACSEETPMQI